MHEVLVKALTEMDRIVAAEDALAEAGAVIQASRDGRVIALPGFPHVYDTNVVRGARLDRDCLDAQLERFSRHLAKTGSRHLQLCFDDRDLEPELGGMLERRGFARDVLLTMVLRQARVVPRNERVRIAEVPVDAAWRDFERAIDRMNREEPWYSPLVSREITGALRRKSELDVLGMHVALLDGAIVGTLGVARSGQTASLLSIGTVPEARRRGVATTMIANAVEGLRASGVSLIYLIARERDEAQHLYRTLGFSTLRTFETYLRT